ncbi:hypothetical protein H2203_004682 [Taxawa tesnikishii (nom. ined.)]|nr:hypothetical protein H2203_004682 [Dothideales sp. JES 119]
MDQVYGNATMTIAAAASESVHGGLFRRWEKRQCCLPYDQSETSKSVYVQEDLPESINYLADRAWTFQERVLSRRVLTYSGYQVTWHCPTDAQWSYKWSVYSERLPDGTPYNDGVVQAQDMQMYDKAADYWTHAVQEYSRRSMSRPEDKLKALAGLAKLVYRSTGDEYLAGLWKEDLPLQLCWHVLCPVATPVPVPWAPSWSWASLDGRIASLNGSDQEKDTHFEVVDARAPPASPLDRFGEVDVANCVLTVRGLLQYAFEVEEEDKDQPWRWNYFDLENHEVPERPRSAWLFRVTVRAALMLEHVGDNKYRRVGLYHSAGTSHGDDFRDLFPHKFRDAVVETIKII